MSYSIKPIANFEKQLKRLVKKYPSLKLDLKVLGERLKQNPAEGISIGNNCYKIRLAITSKGKGKSGGARVITHIIIIKKKTVYLLSIFDKSETESLTTKQINDLLQLLP